MGGEEEENEWEEERDESGVEDDVLIERFFLDGLDLRGFDSLGCVGFLGTWLCYDFALELRREERRGNEHERVEELSSERSVMRLSSPMVVGALSENILMAALC